MRRSIDMETIREIMSKYTTGEATLEETNAALEGFGLHLDPERNTITEAEKLATTVGWYPQQANGWGLLDTGTGSLDKAEVRNGHLVNNDLGVMPGQLYIAGEVYDVHGRELVEVQEANDGKPVQKDIDWRTRHPEAAGQVLRQVTKKGVFDVYYNEIGQAVKATKVTFD